MREYVTDAVVLDKKPNGDMDVRVFLFTKKFGKLIVKAKSARKITSKLSAHLEPGNLVQVRLIEKNGLQVVDALKKDRVSALPSDLHRFQEILAEGEPDQRVWHELTGEKFRWPHMLRILGWDPAESSCGNCGRTNPEFFRVNDQIFFCEPCVFKEFPSESSRSLRLNKLFIRLYPQETKTSQE